MSLISYHINGLYKVESNMAEENNVFEPPQWMEQNSDLEWEVSAVPSSVIRENEGIKGACFIPSTASESDPASSPVSQLIVQALLNEPEVQISSEDENMSSISDHELVDLFGEDIESISSSLEADQHLQEDVDLNEVELTSEEEDDPDESDDENDITGDEVITLRFNAISTQVVISKSMLI